MTDLTAALADDPAPPAIGLAVPEGWIDLDLEPATRNAAIGAIVDEHFAADDPALRDEVVGRLRSAAARAQDAGGVVALLYCDVLDEEPYVLAASLVITMHRTDGGMSPARIEAELAASEGAQLSRRDTAAGPAVRISGRITDVYPGEDEEVELDSVRYFVPFDRGAGLAVLSFSTINLDLADDFRALFDEMAATLELERPAPGA